MECPFARDLREAAKKYVNELAIKVTRAALELAVEAAENVNERSEIYFEEYIDCLEEKPILGGSIGETATVKVENTPTLNFKYTNLSGNTNIKHVVFVPKLTR